MKRNIASIYIHWPFCTKLCNYCNFNKYVNTDSKLPNQLVKCLKIEGKTILKKANINKISTIYFGGGTPSLIPPEKIKEVIDVAKDKNIPLRVGVNAGSLEKDLQLKYGEPNSDALVESAMRHVKILEKFNYDNFKLSIKSSDIYMAVESYQKISDLIETSIS